MNTKLLIQVNLQTIPIHSPLTVKLQLPCHFHHPQYCLHHPRYDESYYFCLKGICAIWKLTLYSQWKVSYCLSYFGQKFPVNGKIARKSTYFYPVTEELWQINAEKIYLFFTETISIKQYRKRPLVIIYCEWKTNKIKYAT